MKTLVTAFRRSVRGVQFQLRKNNYMQDRDMPISASHNRLLTPEEAADFLQVSPATLAVWRSNERYRLRYYKIGSLVRYKHEDLITFADSETSGIMNWDKNKD